MNRVRINLGADHQAQAPVFFGIPDGDLETEGLKAIISLNEVYPQTSLAEICWIKDPLKKVDIGDRLSRLDEIPDLDGDSPDQDRQERDLGSPSGDPSPLALPDFLRSFHHSHSNWTAFCLALVKIGDWELKGDLLGRMERQRLFQQLVRLLKAQSPAPELLARYSPDTLILVQRLSPPLPPCPSCNQFSKRSGNN